MHETLLDYSPKYLLRHSPVFSTSSTIEFWSKQPHTSVGRCSQAICTSITLLLLTLEFRLGVSDSQSHCLVLQNCRGLSLLELSGSCASLGHDRCVWVSVSSREFLDKGSLSGLSVAHHNALVKQETPRGSLRRCLLRATYSVLE